MVNIEMVKDIKKFKEWTTIESIQEGWSEDTKFYIEDKHGKKYMLRLSNIHFYENKKLEYKYLKELSKFKLNISTAIDFGICNGGKSVYIIFKWLEGRDAIHVLPNLNNNDQYKLGIQAGKILKNIHSLNIGYTRESWYEVYTRKINNGIKSYKESGYSLPYEKDIINYIIKNERLLKDRKVTFQHGDFHLGNMIINDKNQIGIIDFNRASIGDPWEEYDRFVFTWEKSIDFANGQIHGYFDNIVPEEFFRLMCLYNARNSLASIPWATRFGKAEIEVALNNIEKYYKVYHGYNNHIPEWYEEPKKKY